MEERKNVFYRGSARINADQKPGLPLIFTDATDHKPVITTRDYKPEITNRGLVHAITTQELGSWILFSIKVFAKKPTRHPDGLLARQRGKTQQVRKGRLNPFSQCFSRAEKTNTVHLRDLRFY